MVERPDMGRFTLSGPMIAGSYPDISIFPHLRKSFLSTFAHDQSMLR
tara:strand:+ start:5665 stop:5805 length:141 start_codon:yes stop_codon:yes gene_type:complete